MIELQKYESVEELEDTKALLDKHGYSYSVSSEQPGFDPTFSAKEINLQFIIKVEKTDLEKINFLLNSELQKINLKDIPDDYYLLDFSNEELLEVLLKSDEWSREDYNLAQILLSKRGKPVSYDMLEKIKEKRMFELSKPESFDIDFSWLTTLFLGSMTGGLWSVYLSWGHLTLKKPLPNGEMVYRYDKQSRKNAEKMLWVSLIITLIWVIIIFSYIL